MVKLLKLGKKKTVTQTIMPLFRQCYKELLQKAQQLISDYKRVLETKNWTLDYLEYFEKNIIVLTFEFTKLQANCPISFSGMISEIMKFSIQLMEIDWRRPLVPKCGMLMLLQNLNIIDYFCKPKKEFDHLYQSVGSSVQGKLFCSKEFYG